MSAGDDPVWLSEDEEAAWRAIAQLMSQLPGVLDRQLQRDSGLSLFEYFVLSGLSMSPDHTMRMSDLAMFASGSLSRLSNVVKRLEAHGLVERRPDPDDGRYTIATLTTAGRRQVVAAAPGHVNAVRRHVIAPLTTGQLRALAAAAPRIAATLDDEGDCLP